MFSCTFALIGSLPLMGIGNSGRPFHIVGADSDLITPHGDRKPKYPTHGMLDSSLITPHGDRKP